MGFEDGHVEHDDFKNVFFLHICDVINIYVNKRAGVKTKLVLKTELLSEIKEDMADMIFTKLLKGKNLDRFNYQIDEFYIAFCYYCNTSFIPIYMCIEKDSKVFVKSKKFTNDLHFTRHQEGKMNSINFTNLDTMARYAYRSV
jgi:hypothetical protein